MSNIPLAVAIVLGALPACMAVSAEDTQSQPPPGGVQYIRTAGNCRPDIGPAGVLKIYPGPTEAAAQSVRIMKIPDHKGAGAVTLGWAGSSQTLKFMKDYTLKVRFKDGAADLTVDGKTTTIKVPVAILPFDLVEIGKEGQRVLLVDNDAGAVNGRQSDKIFFKASLLLVFGDTGSGDTYVATLSIAE